jgi:mannose-6-phosphate isomerase-like protein (cupin superfamily)
MRKLPLMFLLAGALVPVGAQPNGQVVFIPAKEIESSIHSAPANEMGESEIDLIERTPDHAGILLRRTKPGKAEVHQAQGDVWYVIDGGCTFVTGGKVVAGVHTDPGEIRGSGIQGGEERQIAKGDFIRVPAGVPHWVKKITGTELVYIVVKYPDK